MTAAADSVQPQDGVPATGGPHTIKILSTLAVMGAMPALAAICEAATGSEIVVDFSPTVALLDRLRGGEAADIAILTAQGIDDLTHENIIHPGSRTDVALSFVGIAIRAGAPKPEIGSPDAFRAALLAARSIAYSRIGASGRYFASLIQQLDIAAEVNAKAVVVASGFTAERVASGEVELAVQQISELLVVPGIEVVGPLPRELQAEAMFSAGVLTAARQPEAAAAVVQLLTSPEAAPVLRRAGLEPVRRD